MDRKEKRYTPIQEQIIDLQSAEELPEELEKIMPTIAEYNQRLAEDLVVESGKRKKIEREKRERAVEKLIDYLEKEKIIEYGPNSEIICDLEGIIDITPNKLADAGIHLSNKKNGAVKNWQTAAFDFFKDKLIYSKKDWQQKQQGQDTDPKPLFYLPDKDEAFDINAIKKKRFLFNSLRY